jgi:hypothetical protein
LELIVIDPTSTQGATDVLSPGITTKEVTGRLPGLFSGVKESVVPWGEILLVTPYPDALTPRVRVTV